MPGKMPRILTALLALTALFLGALTVACDADDDHGDRNGTTSATSPAATATRDPGPPCTNDATREAQRGSEDFYLPDDEAHCRLRPALLALGDLPEGWAVSDDWRPWQWPRDAAVFECGISFPDFIAGFEMRFQRAEEAQVLTMSQEVYALESGAAERAMNALYRSCALRSQDADNPLSAQLTSAPSAGDDGIALTTSLADIKVLTTVIRVGDLIAVLRVTDPELIASDDLAKTIARRMALVRPIEPEAFTNEGCQPPSKPDEVATATLAGALLKLEEFPAGWVEDPPEPCGLIGAESDCDEQRMPDPKAYVETQFAGYSRDFAFQSVRLYSRSNATKAWSAIRSAARERSECTISASDVSLRRTILPVGGSPFGEGVAVWRVMSWLLPDGESTVYLACAFRVENTIVFLVTAPVGEQLGGIGFPNTLIEPYDPVDQFVIDNLTPIIEAARREAEAIQPQLD
jgi:hypothetical protein